MTVFDTSKIQSKNQKWFTKEKLKDLMTQYLVTYSRWQDADYLHELENEFIEDHRDLIIDEHNLHDTPGRLDWTTVCQSVGVRLTKEERKNTIVSI